MAASEGYYEEDDLQPCGYCGRKFNLVSLDKHQNVCQKTFIRKRRVFDSKKQRLDAEILSQQTAVSSHATAPPKREQSTKKSHWREKHADLLNTVRAARTCAVAKLHGKPLPPPPPAQIPSDYILCSFCGRHFSPKAADRHIQWCKEQKARLGHSHGPNTAVQGKERLEARTRYKAPSLRKKPQAVSGPNLSVNSSEHEPSPSAGRGHHFPGKPPVRGSTQLNRNREGSPGVRVRGTSLSPTKKNVNGASQSCTETISNTSNTSKIRQPSNRVTANGSPVKSTTSYLPGKGIKTLGNSNKVENGGYNPYAIAEKQMQELEEGNAPIRNRTSYGSKSTLTTGSPRRGKPKINQSSSCSNFSGSGPGTGTFSVHGTQTHEVSPPRANCATTSRVAKPSSMCQANVQLRDREQRSQLGANRASWHALQNFSDSEEEMQNNEHGNRNMRTRYAFSSGDNLNDEGIAARHKGRQNGSKTSMTSKDSDYSSSLSRQRTPSPPLKLPSARLATGRRRRGHASTRGSEGDHRLSTSSSESSLPPLQNRNANYNSSNSSINSCSNSNHSGNDVDTWTARFCHQCGSCYPVSNAKFCCECGARRLCVI